MKLLILLLLIGSKAMAFEVSFLDEPVVGLVGASLANAKAHDLSPFQGGSYNNGAYLDMGDALTREGYHVLNHAEGGATSYDQFNENGELMWTGIQKQTEKCLAYSELWPDRVKVIVFTLLNDCLHSVPCGIEGMDAFLNRVYGAALTANGAGKHVIINALPEWESLRLADAMAFYFGPGWYTISEEDYLILQAKQKAKFENVDWISFIYPWAGADVPMDGLHFDAPDMKKAAHIVSKEIERLIK